MSHLTIAEIRACQRLEANEKEAVEHSKKRQFEASAYNIKIITELEAELYASNPAYISLYADWKQSNKSKLPLITY